MLKSVRLLFVLALALAVPLTTVAPASAFLGHRHPTTHHRQNFIHRHKLLTSVVAGYAAYHYAKKSGKNRAAMGRKKNWAQRHPILTGLGAAALTHHVLKKTNRR